MVILFKMEKWIAFDIGTYTLKVAIFDEEGNIVTKQYENITEADVYYSSMHISEKQESFISRFIKLNKASDVVFVTPPLSNKTYMADLFHAAKKATNGKVVFVESPIATIALYQYLVNRMVDDTSIIIDCGYTKTVIVKINPQRMCFSDVITYKMCGTSYLDAKFAEYLNKEIIQNILSKKEVEKCRKNLSIPLKTTVMDYRKRAYQISRDMFNSVFDESFSIFDEIEFSDDVKRIFLIGGGSKIPRLTENLQGYLMDMDDKYIRIIRGLKTPKGNFDCQTAALVGTLLIVEGKCNMFNNIVNLSIIKKLCNNPYCNTPMSSNSAKCPKCGVDMLSHEFLRCKSCGTVVTKDFYDGNNNFCCKCGKHKLELIKI